MAGDTRKESIARAAYDIGFGAKKHLATFDMVEKLPGWVGLISLGVGIFALYYDPLAEKTVSATLAVFGVAVLYLAFYRSAEYENAGKELTNIFHELGSLYRQVSNGKDVGDVESLVADCRRRANEVSISRQIFLSDWWAHYKFFAQQQVDWIENELNLTFWSDKVPLGARVTLALAVIASMIGLGRLIYLGVFTTP